MPGDYFVELTPPASLPVSSTPTSSTPNDNVDGDDNGEQQDTNGDGVTDGPITSEVITLTPGDEPTNEPGSNGGKDSADDANGNMTLDFGLVACEEISGSVFMDVNADGCDDDGEAAIPNVTVELFECDGAGNPMMASGPIGTTTTDANGDYVFNEDNTECLLPANDYIVVFDIPAGYRATTPNVCGDPNESEVNPDGTTECIDPTDPDSENVDAGLVPLMSIGSTVFSDDNNNGVQDPGELTVGEKGKTITLDLFDAAGNLVATTMTDANGSYIFPNLDPGDYTVSFMPPASLPVSSTTTNTAISLDPFAEPTNAVETGANGGKDKVNGNIDENGDMTVDFGLVPLLSVGSDQRHHQFHLQAAAQTIRQTMMTMVCKPILTVMD